MKKIKQLIILSLILFFYTCLIKSVFAQDGSLDLTFGTNGIVITDIQTNNDYGYDIAIQSDGKLLVAGTSVNGTHNRFAIVRYNTNGTLDNTFDSDGIVTTSIIGGDYTKAAIQGNLLVLGGGLITTMACAECRESKHAQTTLLITCIGLAI